jgi:hypothetical protein
MSHAAHDLYLQPGGEFVATRTPYPCTAGKIGAQLLIWHFLPKCRSSISSGSSKSSMLAHLHQLAPLIYSCVCKHWKNTSCLASGTHQTCIDLYLGFCSTHMGYGRWREDSMQEKWTATGKCWPGDALQALPATPAPLLRLLSGAASASVAGSDCACGVPWMMG